MFFVVDNLHYFQTNSSVHEINTRYKNHLNIPSCRLAAIQTSTTYSAINLFNKFRTRISGPKNGKTIFKSALRKCLLTRFLLHRRIFTQR